MRLSTRARYALRMLLEIAKQAPDTTVSLGTVSRNTDISRRYLDQLAIALKSAGLVVATSGRGGGYRLARPAEEINLGEIVEASIGPINIVECVGNPETCERHDGCMPREVYRLINSRITGVFRQLSLAELTDPDTLSALVENEKKTNTRVRA
ncbi:MAG: Rrf2 family transcriptional regulator [Pseudomonadota bacterium]